MAVYAEGRGIGTEAEPFGLLTEGAAGTASVVLAIIALAGISAGVLASITTIVIGVALIVQAFNAATGTSKSLAANTTAPATIDSRPGIELAGQAMVDIAAGISGIVLGILGLVGVNTPYLIAAALIVFGGSLILSGAIAVQQPIASTEASPSIRFQNTAAVSGLELLVGFAAVILGILSLILGSSWVLVLVGFIAVGAALLIVSASFSTAVVRVLTSTP